ncbi:MAG: N-acetyltransferase [Clostridiaceae bacterium]|nr:GNAT family N-acetyltransferase [Eubacteriales bacterium]
MPQADYVLKDGRTVAFSRPGRENAAEMLAFLSAVGKESDFLLNDGTIMFTLGQEEDFLEASAKDALGGIFVGRVGGELICSFGLTTSPRERARHNVTIGLTVLKSYWGLGIGSAIFSYALDFARETGILKNMWLGVRADNERAIALYEKFGFREIGRHKNALYVKGVYYDEILMDLEL